MTWFIFDYDRTKIYITDLWREWYIPKFRIYMTVNEPELTISWNDREKGQGGDQRRLVLNYLDVVDGYSGYVSNPSSAADLMAQIEAMIDSAWTSGTGGDLLTAKADLLSHDGLSDTILPGGTNEYFLQRVDIESTGLKWVPGSTVVAAGVSVTDTDTVDLTKTGAAISADVKKQMSITSDASGIKLVSDAASPGNSKYYGTDSGGTKGFHAVPTQYTDEMSQDASAALFTPDDGDVDYTYNDATPSITSTIKNDAVTFAKMQNIATGKLLGRGTAASGDVEEITPSSDFSMSAGAIAITKATRKIFGQDAAAIAGTATTSEEVLFSVLIPGGTVVAGDSVDFDAMWWINSVAAGTKQVNVRVHTSAAVAGTIVSGGFVAATSGVNIPVHLVNKIKMTTGVVGSTMECNYSTTSPFTVGTLTTIALPNINLASDWYVIFTSDKVNAADAITLRWADVFINKA